MDPVSLIRDMADRGVVLRTSGDQLLMRGPLSERDRQTIRDHKSALLEALRQRQLKRSHVVEVQGDPPNMVEGVPLAEIKAVAGEDWPDLAGNPEALHQFVESCIWTGDLTLSSRAKLAEVLGRAWLPGDPKSSREPMKVVGPQDPDADILGRLDSDWVEPCLSPSPADLRRRQEVKDRR